jgi:excisionase family DNA binding protein
MAKTKNRVGITDTDSGTKLLSSAEAAEYLGYHPVSIRRLVSRGDLRPHTKVGKSLLFLRAELDVFRMGNAWARNKITDKEIRESESMEISHMDAPIDLKLKAPRRPRKRLIMFENPPAIPYQHKDMKAVATVYIKGKPQLFMRLDGFHWEDIPSIRAKVEARHGNIPFQITVETVDGAGFEINYKRSSMEAENSENLGGKKGRKGRMEAFLIN